jgi:hypothetical protein
MILNLPNPFEDCESKFFPIGRHISRMWTEVLLKGFMQPLAAFQKGTMQFREMCQLIGRNGFDRK